MKGTNILIVDSSVIVKWVSGQNEPHLEQADRILQDCQDGIHTLYAPALGLYEVGNALIKGKKLSVRDVHAAIDVLFLLPIQFITETVETALSAARIAAAHGMTYYDASFVALATALGGVLITDNIRHQGKAKECSVIALAAY